MAPTSGGVYRNSLWNAIGLLAPVVVAVFAVPHLVSGLGNERFGILTVVWVLTGYFSIFDLGLGRALTQLLSELRGTARQSEIPPLMWTGLTAMLTMGLFGALIVAGGVTIFSGHIMTRVPAALQRETLDILYLIAIMLPLIVITTGLRAVLEVHNRFDWVNGIRLPIGILMYLVPLAVLPFTHSLTWIVAALLVVRAAGTLAHLVACIVVVPGFLASFEVRRRMLRPLLRFGGFMTVSNILAPVMTYMDRFMVSAIVGVQKVAFYTTPFEILSRATLVPSGVSSALFPVFAASYRSSPERNRKEYTRSLKFLVLILFPPLLVATVFAPELLRLWLSPEFARESAPVVRLLAVGVLLNCLAYIPAALVQASGRPDLTTRLHVIEFVFYVPAIWFLTRAEGNIGAAMAWTGRASLEAVVIFCVAEHLLPAAPGRLRLFAIIGTACGAMVVGPLLTALPWKILFLGLAIPLFLVIVWTRALDPDERALLRLIVRRRRRVGLAEQA